MILRYYNEFSLVVQQLVMCLKRLAYVIKEIMERLYLHKVFEDEQNLPTLKVCCGIMINNVLDPLIFTEKSIEGDTVYTRTCWNVFSLQSHKIHIQTSFSSKMAHLLTGIWMCGMKCFWKLDFTR